MALRDAFTPFDTAWEPMPQQRPPVRRCPACRSVPIWRHNVRCYWLVCTNCGLNTAAFRKMEDAAAAWNIGSEATERVAALRELTEKTMDELVEAALEDGYE